MFHNDFGGFQLPKAQKPASMDDAAKSDEPVAVRQEQPFLRSRFAGGQIQRIDAIVEIPFFGGCFFAGHIAVLHPFQELLVFLAKLFDPNPGRSRQGSKD